MSAQIEKVTASTLQLERVSERLQNQFSTFKLDHGSKQIRVVTNTANDKEEAA
jgi:hypothetical protein